MDDQSATVNELKAIVKKFCEDREWDQFHNPKDLAIGISTEANELLQLFRFKSEDQIKRMLSDPKTRKAIAAELVDALYFVLRFAQMNSFDLSNELQEKISDNERRYPVERSRGSNRKYDE